MGEGGVTMPETSGGAKSDLASVLAAHGNGRNPEIYLRIIKQIPGIH
jgi:hypothetical protein